MIGGTGSRLWPMTSVVNKHLLPIYSKPMSHYSLSSIMACGIREIIAVCDPNSVSAFEDLYGDGSSLGIDIRYIIQKEPKGIAHGIILAKNMLKLNQPFGLFLGDNIFYGSEFFSIIKRGCERVVKDTGAGIFAYEVADPERYGVVSFTDGTTVDSIEEKPKNPKSNFAVPGIYFFEYTAIDFALSLSPSDRGEIEITSLIQKYLDFGDLHCEKIPMGVAWLDTGTFSSLADASEFVRAIETRQGLNVCSPEEIAYTSGWISREQFYECAKRFEKNSYGANLLRFIRNR
jgi:glucose-1-phosphate thymidylyltransferase